MDKKKILDRLAMIAVALVIVGVCIFYTLYDIEHPAEVKSIECTVDNLHEDSRKAVVNGAVYFRNYYYADLIDNNGTTAEAKVPEKLYISLHEGDKVTVKITSGSDTGDVFATLKSMFKGTAKKYSINNYEIEIVNYNNGYTTTN